MSDAAAYKRAVFGCRIESGSDALTQRKVREAAIIPIKAPIMDTTRFLRHESLPRFSLAKIAIKSLPMANLIQAAL
ncbi:hypothetical protein NS258_08850 [Sphingomonas sanguinis]|uniref:Uncharacterized protein n=1 Tax=Sphingomonas sanguinis TaxID=33051 RepID=A0A147J8L9_9SPHN|nr:hypothetical protein NS258_08850 [Sphingomonas sanguinis]